MSSIEGMRRKRSREEFSSDSFHLLEISSKAPKFLGSKGKGNAVAAEEGREVLRREDEGDRFDLESAVPVPENELEIHPGFCWWDFLWECPCFSTVDEQLLLGWFPFAEASFEDFHEQNEVLWDVDLWQIKDIHEIPNQ